MDNRTDPVREFLDSVRAAKFEELRCQRKVLELDAQCHSITANLSGMPGGGSGDKHKDGLWAALSDQRDLYVQRLCEAAKRQQEVEDFVNQLADTNHRAILTLRYIDLYGWPRVLAELEKCGIYYSERQIFRLHGDALQAARVLWADLHPGEGVCE